MKVLRNHHGYLESLYCGQVSFDLFTKIKFLLVRLMRYINRKGGIYSEQDWADITKDFEAQTIVDRFNAL